jgi:hypothetical protein
VNRIVNLSMPGYVAKALQCFLHPKPAQAQHSPHAWIKPQYGASTQLTAPIDTSPLLNKNGVTRIQQIIGIFLYYARAIDSTMLIALGSLAAVQTKATQLTNTAVSQLLDYAATYPDAVVCFCSSAMILTIDSDATYLSEAKACSHAGRLFFLCEPPPSLAPAAAAPPLSSAIHMNSNILRIIAASATEAEFAALFIKSQDTTMLRTTLAELGHPRPTTPIQTDNECAMGIANDTVHQKRSKAPLTCASTGSVTSYAKASSSSTGNAAPPM